MAVQLAILARPESGIRDAVEAIAAAEPAVLIHCQAGRDRTGIVIALVLAAIGVVDDDIAADYSASDEALAAEYERFSKEQPDTTASISDAIARRRGLMKPLLRAVRDGYGSAVGYLDSMGVAPASIARLREI